MTADLCSRKGSLDTTENILGNQFLKVDGGLGFSKPSSRRNQFFCATGRNLDKSFPDKSPGFDRCNSIFLDLDALGDAMTTRAW
jgi:hypothetical protein